MTRYVLMASAYDREIGRETYLVGLKLIIKTPGQHIIEIIIVSLMWNKCSTLIYSFLSLEKGVFRIQSNI